MLGLRAVPAAKAAAAQSNGCRGGFGGEEFCGFGEGGNGFRTRSWFDGRGRPSLHDLSLHDQFLRDRCDSKSEL